MPRYGFLIMHWRKSANKAVIGTFFAALRFGVATPLYPKTPLHKKCPIQRRYAL